MMNDQFQQVGIVTWPLLAWVGFTTPVMLGGLALLLAPILAHLWQRTPRRRIVFPTLRYLHRARTMRAEHNRLNHWLLLLLRCLVLVFVTLAFAEPLWVTPRTTPAAITPGSAVVLLLDMSASTGQLVNGISVFQRLRTEAARRLEQLATEHDRAEIVLVSAQPVLAAGRMKDPSEFHDTLTRLEATGQRADWPTALAMAGQLLESHPGPRQLWVFSDGQRSNWVEMLSDSGFKAAVPADVEVMVAPFVEGSGHNIGLSEPTIGVAQPIVGQSVRLQVTVSNYQATSHNPWVRFLIDGREVGAEQVDLKAWDSKLIGLDITWQETGRSLVEFVINEDDFAADNRACLLVRAVRRPAVLILSEQDANRPDSAAYFISRALVPLGDHDATFELRVIHPDTIHKTGLSEFAAVFAVGLTRLDQPAQQDLTDYVHRGGTLVCFPSMAATLDALRDLDQRTPVAGLLPCDLSAALLEARDPPRRITQGMWNSLLLQDFDLPAQAAWEQIAVWRLWSFRGVRSDAQVLLSYDDGTVALAWRPVERGRVLLANVSPATTDSELAGHGVFVMLMHRLAWAGYRSMSPTATGTVGEPLVLTARISPAVESQGLRVTDPAGSEMPARLEVDGSLVSVTVPQTVLPGLHQLHLGDQVLAAAVVNLDPRESDLRRFDYQQLARVFETAGAVAVEQDLTELHPTKGDRSRPLWPWCMAAALLALALESMLVRWTSR